MLTHGERQLHAAPRHDPSRARTCPSRRRAGMLRDRMSTDRRSTVLLAAGALAGLTLAAVQLVWRPEAATALSPDVVASVNGVAISRADYEQALAGVAG